MFKMVLASIRVYFSPLVVLSARLGAGGVGAGSAHTPPGLVCGAQLCALRRHARGSRHRVSQGWLYALGAASKCHPR